MRAGLCERRAAKACPDERREADGPYHVADVRNPARIGGPDVVLFVSDFREECTCG